MLKTLAGILLAASLSAPPYVIERILTVPSGRHGRGHRQAMRLINLYADEHGNNNGQVDSQELQEARYLLRDELEKFQDTDGEGRVSIEEEAEYHRQYAGRSGYHILQRFLHP